ncbi:hypothetical protein ACP3P8_02575 [Pseudomonas aeruginosa]
MRIAPISRSPLLQWLSFALCACVLVNALACGVLHLQALGVGSDKGRRPASGCSASPVPANGYPWIPTTGPPAIRHRSIPSCR